MKDGLVKIGALWKGKDKDGQPILSGSMNVETRILVLKNGFKREDKQPDYYVYLVASEKKEGSAKQDRKDEDVPF